MGAKHDMKTNKLNLMKLWPWSESTMEKMKINGYGVLNMRSSVSMYAEPSVSGSHQSEPEPTSFPLRMAGEGEKVKIFSLNGGKNFHDRLAGLGLHVGERLEIIQNRKDGKLLLGHGNARFFLGGGMSWKIQVIVAADEK